MAAHGRIARHLSGKRSLDTRLGEYTEHKHQCHHHRVLPEPLHAQHPARGNRGEEGQRLTHAVRQEQYAPPAHERGEPPRRRSESDAGINTGVDARTVVWSHASPVLTSSIRK